MGNETGMVLVLVIAWVAVKFGINTMSVALKFPFSMQQEWYLSQILLLFPVNTILDDCTLSNIQ